MEHSLIFCIKNLRHLSLQLEISLPFELTVSTGCWCGIENTESVNDQSIIRTIKQPCAAPKSAIKMVY